MIRTDKREEKMYVFCPICGHYTCRSSDSAFEKKCEVCKNTIVIEVKNNWVLAFKSRRKAERH